MIKIGITGSIGMGKTTVSKMFRALNIPVFDSDEKVREILEGNRYVIDKISKIWPEAVFITEAKKRINKNILSNKIFYNCSERKKLEKIIHPLVRKERNIFRTIWGWK